MEILQKKERNQKNQESFFSFGFLIAHLFVVIRQCLSIQIKIWETRRLQKLSRNFKMHMRYLFFLILFSFVRLFLLTELLCLNTSYILFSKVLLDSAKRKEYDDELKREELLNFFRNIQNGSQEVWAITYSTFLKWLFNFQAILQQPSALHASGDYMIHKPNIFKKIKVKILIDFGVQC